MGLHHRVIIAVHRGTSVCPWLRVLALELLAKEEHATSCVWKATDSSSLVLSCPMTTGDRNKMWFFPILAS